MTGRKETGCMEMGQKEAGGKEMGGKATGAKEMRGKVTGAREKGEKGTKATGAQDSQEMGGKGDVMMGEMEMDNMLPGDMTAGHNATEEIRRKSYSGSDIGGDKKSEDVCGQLDS